MIIKVDVREAELIKMIGDLCRAIPSFKELQIVTENLPLGDIIISNGVEDKLIVERKSVNDLLASIKDGRYEEQSYRLNGLNHHNHNIIYLIEGDVNRVNRFKDNRIDKITLYSAIFSLNYYKGFSVLRTFNIEETAVYICNTANKLRKCEIEKRTPYYNHFKTIHREKEEKEQDNQTKEEKDNQTKEEKDNQTKEEKDNQTKEEKEQDNEEETEKIEQSEKDYVSVIKKVKKENITPENIGEIMLCQIPGISSVTALAIMDTFKTIPNLIASVQTDEKCLDNISYTNSKNQQRKINKTSIANISKFLVKK